MSAVASDGVVMLSAVLTVLSNVVEVAVLICSVVDSVVSTVD